MQREKSRKNPATTKAIWERKRERKIKNKVNLSNNLKIKIKTMQEKIENILNSINLKKVNVHFYVHLITFINFWKKKKYPFDKFAKKREKERERKVRKVRRGRAREDDCKVVTRWLVEHAEKDLGFLRIGSLNVRVKRTTEAFSQFLGVATSSASSNHEKIHKSWGSADNVQLDQKMMPPPKYAPIKKRRSRRAQDFSSLREHQTASQPTTPLLQGKVSRSSHQQMHRRPTSTTAVSSAASRTQQSNDSDSDTACGFDSAWRGSAQL